METKNPDNKEPDWINIVMNRKRIYRKESTLDDRLSDKKEDENKKIRRIKEKDSEKEKWRFTVNFSHLNAQINMSSVRKRSYKNRRIPHEKSQQRKRKREEESPDAKSYPIYLDEPAQVMNEPPTESTLYCIT